MRSQWADKEDEKMALDGETDALWMKPARVATGEARHWAKAVGRG